MTITPDQLREARAALGERRGLSRPVTQKELAAALEMGKHGWQTISAWENGDRPIPGPAAIAIRCLVEHEMKEWEISWKMRFDLARAIYDLAEGLTAEQTVDEMRRALDCTTSEAFREIADKYGLAGWIDYPET